MVKGPFCCNLNVGENVGIYYVGERGGGGGGKQVGSMNEESQVSSCYNITFIYTNQETV